MDSFDLVPGIVFELKLTSIFNRFTNELCASLMDGRVASLVSERLICGVFGNVINKASGNTQFDCFVDYDGKQQRVELKTMTKHGIKIQQSKSIGIGRVFDELEAEQWKSKIDFFLIVDATHHGKLRFSLVDSTKIGVGQHSVKVVNSRFFNNQVVQICN